MQYLTNDRNVARLGALTATNVIASNAVYRTDTDAKDGNGDLRLTGDYTGAADATFDVQIVSGTATARRVSTPVIAGVGNGTMTGLTADGTVDEQEFTVTLEDLGTLTLAAGSPLLGLRIVARATGSDGNLITVAISAAGLAYAATDYSLQTPLLASVVSYVGDQWDFGAAPLNSNGTIPATAPRLRFGNDPQVYRQYKYFEDGEFVYEFSPRILRDVQAGSRVRTVSGSRTVTITDGTTTDPLTDIVTVYDLFAKVNAESALCKIVGPVINDQRPHGQGMTECSVYTASYIASVLREGSTTITATDFDIDVAAASPTETLTITCTDATTPNAEVWEVRGVVSGQLDDAVTGEAFADGAYTFTIPAAPLPPAAGASVSYAELRPRSRGVGNPHPELCSEDLITGSRARNHTYKFRWETRAIDCNCDDAEIIGGPDPDLLGVPTTGGSPVSEQSRLRRLQKLSDYIRTFVASNTGRPDDVFVISKHDLELAKRSAQIFAQGLEDVADGTTIWPIWTASTVIAVDVIREPTPSNGYRYSYSGGTTAASQPTWPTTVGATVSDGTGTWTNIGATVFSMWDSAFTDLQTDLSGLIGRSSTVTADSNGFGIGQATVFRTGATWATITEWGENTLIGLQRILPATKNGHTYKAEGYTGTAPYASGVSEPTWPTNGSTVADGDMVWRDMGAYWTATSAVTLGAVVEPFNGYRYECTTAGTTGATEPDWTSLQGVSQTDGSVVWRITDETAPGNSIKELGNFGEGPGGLYPVLLPKPDEYYERWISVMDAVRAAAGIAPDFDSAGLDGNRIWRDRGGAAWFVSLDGLLPLQPGWYYHSARLLPDDFGHERPVSTMEFGIGVFISCAELEDGDELWITFDLAGVARPAYQQGDRVTAKVNRAQPIALYGGQTGTDEQIWSVVGSVDGALINYELSLVTPAAYSDGGLAFLINQGAIPFALGDKFTASVSASRFKWRKNAGAYSADTDIAATVSLSDGLSASFGEGVAPSWVTGDAWTFAAEAIYGVAQMRQPTDGALQWATSTVIEITAATGIEGILIADHTIASTATITLTGSDDNFATTPLSQAVTYRAGSIWHPITASRAKYRLTINEGGSIRWLWLGVPLALTTWRGMNALGAAVRRVRLPGPAQRRGDGVRIDHEWLAQTSVDALLDSLSHACTYDDATFGALVHPELPALVRVSAESIDIEDEQTRYQATDSTKRRLALSLDLAAVA